MPQNMNMNKLRLTMVMCREGGGVVVGGSGLILEGDVCLFIFVFSLLRHVF